MIFYCSFKPNVFRYIGVISKGTAFLYLLVSFFFVLMKESFLFSHRTKDNVFSNTQCLYKLNCKGPKQCRCLFNKSCVKHWHASSSVAIHTITVAWVKIFRNVKVWVNLLPPIFTEACVKTCHDFNRYQRF